MVNFATDSHWLPEESMQGERAHVKFFALLIFQSCAVLYTLLMTSDDLLTWQDGPSAKSIKACRLAVCR